MARTKRRPAKQRTRAPKPCAAEREPEAAARESPDAKWAADIARRALASCHPFQHEAVVDPARRFTWLVGRGGGKTTAFKVRFAIDLARTHRGRFVYVAPTLGMAAELLWDPLKDLCDRLGIMDSCEFKEQGKTCTFSRTGAKLRLVGADDRREIDKLRGQPFDGVGVDEVALFPPELVDNMVNRVIGPRLGERDGWLGLASTPGTILQGLFFEASCTWFRREDGTVLHRPYKDRELPEYAGWRLWSSHAWDLEAVAALPDADTKYPAIVANWNDALERKAAEKISDDNPVWMRERKGLWAQDETENIYKYRAFVDGKPHNQWDPPIDKMTGFAQLPMKPDLREPLYTDWLYGYGQDMGSKDPYACNVFAMSPSDPDRVLYHVYSFGKTQMYARLIATLFIGEEAVARVLRGENVDYEKTGAGLFAVTGWPTAIVADLAALGEAVINELAQVYGIRIKAAEKKGKHAEIAATNGDLHDGKIKILKGSALETQLASLQWRRDEYNRPSEGKGDRNDHTDSLIYIRREMIGLFASGLAAPKAPAAAPLYSDPMDLGGNDARGEFDDMLAGVDDEDWGNE